MEEECAVGLKGRAHVSFAERRRLLALENITKNREAKVALQRAPEVLQKALSEPRNRLAMPDWFTEFPQDLGPDVSVFWFFLKCFSGLFFLVLKVFVVS